jgi:hypothetical protein
MKPPVAVAKNAAKGLELREKHGRGGTEVGVARAKQLKARETLDEDDVKSMASYFARHAVDRKGKAFDNADNPSAGYIAWMLWGGDEAKEWVDGLKKRLQN